MSSLDDALTDYLAARRALGTQLRWPEGLLRRFVNFVESQGAQFITIDLVLRWVAAPENVKPATRARYLGLVRGLATWLQVTDPRTQVPPKNLLPIGQRRPVPYIFSDQEVVDLLSAAHRMGSASGLRPWTYATLVGLLAATGLRPGEALALDVADVDLASGVLAVRDSKFGKSRFVPLDVSTQEALAAYACHRDRIRPGRETSAFLVSERGTRLQSCSTRRTFARLSQKVGLRTKDHPKRIGRGPRLGDLRHTFATRRLVEWYRCGEDVERLVPLLSTYLGHAGVASTYWYIQAVPELLQLATERSEAAFRGGEQ